MPATGPNRPMDGPRLVPPVSGLLAQVPVLVDNDLMAGWMAGVELRPENLAAPELADVCAVLSLSSAHTGVGVRTIKPFGVIVHDTCSTWGWDEADYEGRATRSLDVKRHVVVEREFERGTLVAANPNLAQMFTTPTDPTATVLLAGGARVSPRDGLALLDEAIAYSAAMIGRGIIHATPFLIGQWMAEGMLTVDGMREAGYGMAAAALRAFSALSFDPESSPGFSALGPLAGSLAASAGSYGSGRTQFYSPKGNIVIAGNGYEGWDPQTGAVVAAHASQWAFATDPIAVLASSPVTTPGTLAEAKARAEATDFHRNTVTIRQDQMFAVLWPGLLHAAVQIATTTATVA